MKVTTYSLINYVSYNVIFCLFSDGFSVMINGSQQELLQLFIFVCNNNDMVTQIRSKLGISSPVPLQATRTPRKFYFLSVTRTATLSSRVLHEATETNSLLSQCKTKGSEFSNKDFSMTLGFWFLLATRALYTTKAFSCRNKIRTFSLSIEKLFPIPYSCYKCQIKRS